MAEAAYLELLASYEAALDAAKRSLTIALALTEAHRAGRPLPAAVIDAYAAGIERDEAQLAELREKRAAVQGVVSDTLKEGTIWP